MTAEERFWAKVDKSGECWLWTSAISPGGYGAFWLNKSRNELLTQCDDLRKERDAADCEWLKARAALALLKEPR